MVLAGGLIGLLLLNTAMQRGAFQLTALQAQADALHTEQQQLSMKVDNLASPERLASDAVGLGMVPNANPVFLMLRTGRVIGAPTPAGAGGGRALLGNGAWYHPPVAKHTTTRSPKQPKKHHAATTRKQTNKPATQHAGTHKTGKPRAHRSTAHGGRHHGTGGHR